MPKLSIGWLLCLSTVLVSTASVAAIAADLNLEIRGARTAGALLIGKTAVGNRVFLADQELPVTHSGHVVFGFGREARGPQHLRVMASTGEQATVVIELVPRDYKIDRVNGVPQETVTPNPEQVARARREAQLVAAARNESSTRVDFLQPLIKPAKGRISGVYGSQRIFNGEPRTPHYGLDIAAPTGTPVQAPWPGRVVLAEANLFYSGGTLILDHGYGVTSSYIHLHKLHVQVGDVVEQGQVVAQIGATGRATGPHLDWRLNWGQERLDPALALEHFSSVD